MTNYTFDKDSPLLRRMQDNIRQQISSRGGPDVEEGSTTSAATGIVERPTTAATPSVTDTDEGRDEVAESVLNDVATNMVNASSDPEQLMTKVFGDPRMSNTPVGDLANMETLKPLDEVLGTSQTELAFGSDLTTPETPVSRIKLGFDNAVNWSSLPSSQVSEALETTEGMTLDETINTVFGEDRGKAIEATMQAESNKKLIDEDFNYTLNSALATFDSGNKFPQRRAAIREVFRVHAGPNGRLSEEGRVALANAAYGNRADLGNTEDGDGYKYRGRGYIQITGRSRYRRIGEMIGVDLEANPDLLLDPEIARRATVAYFYDKRDTDGQRRNIFGELSANRLASIIGHATDTAQERWNNTGLPSTVPSLFAPQESSTPAARPTAQE